MLIEEDFPQEIINNRKTLLPIHRTALKTCRSYLHGDQLSIDGKKYHMNNLETLPVHLQPNNVTTLTRGNKVAFFTHLSPFSNHHTCKIQIGEKNFNCSEQALMYYKALSANDQATAGRIMDAQNPIDQKNLGKYIKGFNQEKWNQQKDDIMLQVVKEKFTQNKNLGDILISTGTKLLAEGNPSDKYWSTGLSIFDEKIWDSQNWPGKNKLGEVLMAVRSTLVR